LKWLYLLVGLRSRKLIIIVFIVMTMLIVPVGMTPGWSIINIPVMIGMIIIVHRDSPRPIMGPRIRSYGSAYTRSDNPTEDRAIATPHGETNGCAYSTAKHTTKNRATIDVPSHRWTGQAQK
jgi:hypothetical protein